MKEILQQIQKQIDELLTQKERLVVAIDGNCTAGKTTLAEMLAEHYDCNVFHMDDFFLRPEQRTPERYSEVGGNVDYERFKDELLIPLRAGKEFSYRPFDCGTFTLSEPICVAPKRLNIIEGTYSLHPYFGDSYDMNIFLTVTPELQRQRILERPSFLHNRFFEEWIPMERRYFDGCTVTSKCDFVIDLSQA